METLIVRPSVLPVPSLIWLKEVDSSSTLLRLKNIVRMPSGGYLLVNCKDVICTLFAQRLLNIGS